VAAGERSGVEGRRKNLKEGGVAMIVRVEEKTFYFDFKKSDAAFFLRLYIFHKKRENEVKLEIGDWPIVEWILKWDNVPEEIKEELRKDMERSKKEVEEILEWWKAHEHLYRL
jgi:hypothetical protein